MLVSCASCGALQAQTPLLRQLQNSGPSANRVNVVVLGDGYRAEEQEKFFTDAQRKIDLITNNEAFAPFKDLINGYAVFTASNESGTDIPAETIARDTYYGAGFSGSIDSRLLSIPMPDGLAHVSSVLRATVPEYDIVVLLVNTTAYGGAGGFPAIASLHEASDEIFLHETGHAFAGLRDEYVDEASVPSHPPPEDVNINVTQQTERTLIPWNTFLLDTTPVPTLTPSSDANDVGVWEGAYYRASGFYRPTYNSKMRSLGQPFGPVNLRAFAAALHRLNINNATSTGSISAQPRSQSFAVGDTVTLGVSVEGTGPFTYQWSFNGKFIVGQTQPTLKLTSVTAAKAGSYSVLVSNGAGSVTTSEATLSLSGTGSARVVNISTRAYASTGNNVTIGGFVISGSASKRLLLRAVGPTLTSQGINQSEVLIDPTLTVYDARNSNSVIASIDNWTDTKNSAEIVTIAAQLGAAPLTATDATSAATLLTFPPGIYTFMAQGKSATSGIVLVEAYDADATGEGAALVNISTRAYCTTGNGVSIAGFVVAGNAPKRLLLRAVGPTLATQGLDVTEVLADPTIAVHDARNGNTVVATNDNWTDNPNSSDILSTWARVGAAPLAAADSKSSALLLTLQPGVYTVIARGASGTSGIVLVEVYDAD